MSGESLVESIVRAARARREKLFWVKRGEDAKFNKLRRRNHPKRHGENRERSQIALRKDKEAKEKRVKNDAALRQYKDAVRRYWSGEGDHP